MSEKVGELTEENFEKTIENGKGFALVDFWAPWCGPCRMMGPVVDELAESVKGVSFYKINVDDQQNLAARFRVSGIPFFALFKDGKVVASRTGGTSKEVFEEWLNEKMK